MISNASKLACLWPGLAGLWLRGQWRGLAIACGFALLVNWLIVATFIWPESAPLPLQAGGWAIAGLWWAVAAALALRQLPEISTVPAGERHKGLLVAAQGEYLKGNWPQAESLLRKLLRRQRDDVEALLLLATLLRRSGRLDEARLQLQSLARLEAADRWELEIRAERQQLRRQAEQRMGAQTAPPQNADTNSAAEMPESPPNRQAA